MSVVKFRPRHRRRLVVRTLPRPPRGGGTAHFGRWIVLGLGVAVVGLATMQQPAPRTAAQATAVSAQAAEMRVHFEMCGRIRHTCVVDGDTIWLNGQNLRMEGYDTPEPYTAICGGAAEVALAHRASARLLELLNDYAFTVETGGVDGTGKRTLATIRIGGRDVGDILIEEGLARSWPNGYEFWC